MKLSEFLFISDFDPDEKFLVHFDDLDLTDSTVYGSLDKYWDCYVLSFSYNTDRTFVLELRCTFDD